MFKFTFFLWTFYLFKYYYIITKNNKKWSFYRFTMVFSDFRFIYIFLPIFLLTYYLTPKVWKNITLFAGSMIFYSIGSIKTPLHIVIFVFTLIFNYYLGLFISDSKYKKFWLIFGITTDISILAVFKYLNLPLGLPIGISFYTFQAVSYLIDVYRNDVVKEQSFIRYGTYISMFPQLIAGPIVTYSQVRRQLRRRRCDISLFLSGLEIFILGLGSKVILANRVSGLWNHVEVLGFESVSTPLAWMGIIAYSFQIYFDFWGYSLMAIGLGKMLGFDLPENFNYPYMATSVTEFWRRWHMTLSKWFKDYVYIPLGGNRNGKFKQIRNLLIVWCLTGIWHGSGLNFLLWGLTTFIFLIIEKLGFLNILNKYSILGHIYMILYIPLSWTLFVNTDLNKLILFFKRLIGLGGEAVYVSDYIKYGKQYGIWLILCMLCCTYLPKIICGRLKDTILGYICLMLIFIGTAYCLYHGMNDPFLYFQF